MRKFLIWTVNLAIFCVLALGAGALIFYMYENSEVFRTLFNGTAAQSQGPAGIGGGSGPSSEAYQRLSMYIFMGIVIVQIGALYLGGGIISSIKNSAASLSGKLKQLENAEIFLDLPLYVGLFGTVSSFIVMAVSPQTSRLIAYSSTLIGIVFSIVLRLALVYPYRSKLLSVISETETTGE
jgi:hypothetical protein